MDASKVDQLVQTINQKIEPNVDCTSCGACCRGLMINVTEEETKSTASYLSLSHEIFKEKFIESSEQGVMIMNTIPCHFLSENKCTIYENRFNECRDFPHLNKPNFRDRLFGTLIHYGICPIIYNVIEELKVITRFK